MLYPAELQLQNLFTMMNGVLRSKTPNLKTRNVFNTGAGGIRLPVAHFVFAPSRPPAPLNRLPWRFSFQNLPVPQGRGSGFESHIRVCGVLQSKTPKIKSACAFYYGAGGIRTLGTLAGHNSLAGSPIRPLSHRSI